MNRNGSKMINFKCPFMLSCRVVPAFVVAILFSLDASAFYCANEGATPDDFVLSGNSVYSFQNNEFTEGCPAFEQAVLISIDDWSSAVYPLQSVMLEHGQDYYDEQLEAYDIDAIGDALSGQTGSSGMPEPDQIATAFGAGFVIGLPIFGVVFGVRHLFKLMR